MKKTYTKPYLVVESFQLDASIAASCSSQGFILINQGENNCGYGRIDSTTWQFFNVFNCQFDLTGPDGDGNDTLCYHGPTEAMGMTFVSS